MNHREAQREDTERHRGDEFEGIWEAVLVKAVIAGLDPTKFNKAHREILAYILDFLAQPPVEPEMENAGIFTRWLSKPRTSQKNNPVSTKTIPPLIICGKPGTGKTTFLYVLDVVLREHFELPDNITSRMVKQGRWEMGVQKRVFAGISTSLLSVRKWADLLHFYAWDRDQHGLNFTDQNDFIRKKLVPMRVLFTDEVEMTGYSPTLPDLAQQGILVVGTSNQYDFPQLEHELVPPKLIRFKGGDMRAGNPDDAIVTEKMPAWQQFDQLSQQASHTWERLAYQSAIHKDILTVRLNFHQTVKAPFLETEWLNFFEIVCQKKLSNTLSSTPFILLFDDFSLETLRTDYNAIIRFVSLFDAIEQVGLGVLVRNQRETPQLSREAINHMKVTIQSSRGVTEEIKLKTVVGIDRLVSRLGQAGQNAQRILDIQ